VSDRRAWLEEWCPTCWAAPGARCKRTTWSRSGKRRDAPLGFMHCARGWRQRACPTCRAHPEEPCRTPTGREASRPHAARLRPGPRELLRPRDVWEKLERRGATVAVVDFSGRAGLGGQTGRIASLLRRWRPADRCRAVERRPRRAGPRPRGARVGALRHVRRAAPHLRDRDVDCG
jgi:hypothetical protein